MKARIRRTGETVDVRRDGAYWTVSSGIRMLCEDELEFPDDIDWEQRRYEIVRAALPAVMASYGSAGRVPVLRDMMADEALSVADTVIRKLRGDKA